MKTTKFLLGFVVLAAFLAMQVGAVYAAPLSATIPDGTIVSVTQSTDSSNHVVFVVVVTDSNNVQQTVDLTPAEAIAAGLVKDNGNGTYTINSVVGQKVTGGMLFDACNAGGGANPVDAALTAFFCNGSALGTDSITQLHKDGYGYGLIAQACFMAEELKTTCSDLLKDKTNKDFSALGLQGVTNWGQLRKYVSEQVIIGSLGSVMSGQETPLTTSAPGFTHGHGQGGGNGNGHGNGNGNGHGRP